MQFVMDRLTDAGVISPLVYVLVLLGGVMSALSPCFVPVLTMFGGYVTGYARDTGKQPLRMAAAFTAGQAVTLAAVGRRRPAGENGSDRVHRLPTGSLCPGSDWRGYGSATARCAEV